VTHRLQGIGLLGAAWGLAGFWLLIGYTIVRLAPIALEIFWYDLQGYHWAALIANISLTAYLEGYRGFQRGFSPRVAARARYLYHHPNLFHALSAPLFCMGYFYTSRKRQIVVVSLTLGIILLVVLIRRLDQPWRGIIDAGVVAGLSWGLISSIIFGIQAFRSERFDYSPELPEPVELSHFLTRTDTRS
jgi:hypothetical protein